MTNNLLQATFTAPETEVEWHQKTVAASAVALGDLRKGREVRTVKTGSKWTELLDGEGKRIERVEKDHGVLVVRGEQTEESSQAQFRAYRNANIQRLLASRTDRLQAAQAKLNERLDEGREADYSVIGELLQAQAELKLLHWFAGAAATAEEGTDLVDLRNRMCEQLQGRLVEQARYRALSRSTSVLSNVMEDCDVEAMAKFVTDYRM